MDIPLFGFIILSFVLKRHTQQLPNDECSHMLRNNFYIDNLVKTSNSPQRLLYLYNELVQRMENDN